MKKLILFLIVLGSIVKIDAKSVAAIAACSGKEDGQSCVLANKIIF